MEFASTFPPAIQYALRFPTLTITKRYLRAMGWYVQFIVTSSDKEELLAAEQKVTFFGQCRFPTSNIYSPDKKRIGEVIDKGCGYCCIRTRHVEVNVPLGQTIGYYKYENRIASKVLKIFNAVDELLYVIDLGCCFLLKTGTLNFKIFDSRQQTEVGSLSIESKFLQPEVFTLELPESAPINEKILILLAVFHIEVYLSGHQ